MYLGKVIGRVEAGFGNAVLNTWPTVQAALGRMNLAGKKGILVTGHSKGGGMTFPACTLLKNLLPGMLVENCSYAAPLTCDRTFGAAYDAMGLKAFTVRYQNQFDIVPFLPYYPHFAMLASAERLFTGGVNNTITAGKWPALENDYAPLGALRYLGDGCQVEFGDQGETDATNALWHALDRFEFSKIADAHAASGRYHDCICGAAQSTLAIEAQT
ncbi:MAG: hypothetical protein EON92_14320 [Burkholderiales bacterium]|nr:MAG: hypothetical protein EON92_14320 [Burkholderiales bacterium]